MRGAAACRASPPGSRERFSVRSKASKSRSSAVAAGSQGSVSGGRPNGKGAALSDEERTAARRENPLDGLLPWTRFEDETSLGAGARRKPSRGCERLWTERSEGWNPRGIEWTRLGDIAMRAETLAVSLVPKGSGRT